jgi:hypothetical protein
MTTITHIADIKTFADRIAIRLLADLRAGRIPRIDSGTIRSAMTSSGAEQIASVDEQWDYLEGLVTRRVVERVG